MNMLGKAVCLLAGAVVLAGTLTGCGASGGAFSVPTHLASTDIVGSYKSGDGATMTLDDDGTMEVTDFPAGAWYHDADRLSERFSGGGTWAIGADFEDQKTLYIVFHRVEKYPDIKGGSLVYAQVRDGRMSVAYPLLDDGYYALVHSGK